MKNIPDGSIDLVVTDPPFAIEFKSQRSNYNRIGSRVLDGYNEIPKDQYSEFTLKWMREACRALKNSGSMYVFSGWNNLKDLLNVIDEVKLNLINHVIWKYQFGVVTKRKFVTSHYHCLYVCKDDKSRKFFPFSRFNKNDRGVNNGSLHYKDKEDVWYIPREYWTGDQKTPTKLPAELIKKILLYSSEKDDIVLDPFLGSGTTAIAAFQLDRNSIGIEILEEYHKLAVENINEQTK